MAPSRPEFTSWEIIRWWEMRRIPFNIAVGSIGLLSLGLMELIGASIVKPGEDFEEPLAVILGSITFGILANAGYSLGWIIERKYVARDMHAHQAFRNLFFPLGLSASCTLATTPILVAALAWTLHLIW